MSICTGNEKALPVEAPVVGRPLWELGQLGVEGI